ncbi:hypothetical protein LC609_19380 [Nostoc sp. XA013]|nr:hypothetical protein [Nostoc sp. XA013]
MYENTIGGTKKEASNLMEVDMIPLDWAVLILWKPECGEKLKALRGKISRQKIADGINAQQVECSQELIRKLELGVAKSISPRILVALCITLGIHPSALIPSIKMEIPRNFCTEG